MKLQIRFFNLLHLSVLTAIRHGKPDAAYYHARQLAHAVRLG